MRVVVLETGGSRKSDPEDAQAVARAALYRSDLRRVEREDQLVILDLLFRERDVLKGERNRSLNRLYRLFRELIPGGVPRGLDVTAARLYLRTTRAATGADRCQRDPAKSLIGSLDRVEKQMAIYDATIEEAVSISGSTLMRLQGIGSLLTGEILAEAGDLSRFTSADHFASYAGTAPVETSSG